ncbi:MAG: PIN domain-containing protein [Blastochloris sp.]|nr:PIN domain-containing protein [Blastochloris sp.]
MSGFFDTNILIYGQQKSGKGDRARVILAQGGTLSVQVLNEFAAVARRKLGYGWGEVGEAIDDALSLVESPLPLTVETHTVARLLARDHGLSFHDALIVASAIEAGCDTLWSEDMQHGRAIGSLTIRNPFLESAP